MGPSPISWAPSQYWDGFDGPWSSFALRIGSSQKVCRVLPSTAGQATWIVNPGGCPFGETGTEPSQTCEESRGGLFDPAQSKSWDTLGNYSLQLESNLGYGDINATYGEDTIALGFTDENGGPTLGSQVIAGFQPYDYYTGIFGLGSQGTNLTNFTEPRPSFLADMKAKNLIPSLSWAYTAGAPYRSKSVFGSLTFGGYDNSRFVPNNFSFFFAPDISRDLVVGLQSITSITANSPTAQLLLPVPIFTFIDSTLPYIYLPLESCRAFERSFGLSWNDTSQMYWVNETLHQALLTANPTITFTLGNTMSGGPTVDINFPYAAFDLEAQHPLVPSTMRYFPLQRSANESQNTLGRTFLQEAYLITDYERSNFSVSQCKFERGHSKNLIGIPSITETPSHQNPKLIIGASVGAAFLILLAIITLVFVFRRKFPQYQHSKRSNASSASSMSLQNPRVVTLCSVREIDNNSLCGPFKELPDSGKAELQDETSPSGSGKAMPEMSPSINPIVYELRTQYSSRIHSLLRTQSSNKGSILKSTEILRKSWASSESSNGAPCVETVISASGKTVPEDAGAPKVGSRFALSSTSKPLDLSSRNLTAKIMALKSRLPTPLDLDRSLPPTPISESPQISPISDMLRKSLSSRTNPRCLRKVPSTIPWTPTTPNIPSSKFSRGLAEHGNSCSLGSRKGIEITVPPGQSNTNISDVSAMSNEEQISKTTWL